ncbi:MAG: hypothetical protein AABY38_00265 [Planctomycetota bacterium]
MIHLDITKEEKNILIEVLEEYISDLRMEVADTDNMDFREKLKNQEKVLKEILVTLRQVKENV